jgi:hypothetical protein
MNENDSLLNQQDVDFFVNWGDTIADAGFILGDKVVELEDNRCKRRGDKARLHDEILRKSTSIQNSSTVRHAARCARHVTSDIRAEFPALDFYRFLACLSAGTTPDKFLPYCAWAIESADDYGGKPAPATKIRDKIRADNGGAEDDVPEWAKLCGRIVDMADSARMMDDTPAKVKDVLANLTSDLATALSENGAEPEGEASNEVP